MTKIDRHLMCHARLDAASALLAYIGAFFLLAFAVASHSTVTLATMTPLAAVIMLTATALVLELVRVSPHIGDESPGGSR